MTLPRTTDAWLAHLVVVSLIVTSGCVPLPIRHTELVTPEVIGIVRDADGAPAPGIPVAVTESRDDQACTAARGRGLTDSAGAFRIAAVRQTKRVFWFTLMENFGLTRYWLCTERRATAASGQSRAAPARTNITGWARGDTLACVDWTLRGTARVSCNGSSNQRRIFTFGAWSDASDSGAYRLVLVDDDEWGNSYRAVVQWLGRPRAGSPGEERVRAELELPTGDAVLGAAYAVRDGTPTIRMESSRRAKWKWDNRRWLEFALGGPGEARPVPEH